MEGRLSHDIQVRPYGPGYVADVFSYETNVKATDVGCTVEEAVTRVLEKLREREASCTINQ